MKFEHPSCICGNKKFWRVSPSDCRSEISKLSKYGFAPKDGILWLCMCSRCGMGITVPYPDKELLSIYYAGLYRDEKDRTLPEDLFNKEIRWAEYVRNFSGNAITGKMLDAGCGSGGICYALRPWADGIGYDLDEIYLEDGRKYGLDLRKGNIADITGIYDTIILRHVLEHVDDPIEILKKLRSLLADGGNLYVEVPNIKVEAGLPEHQMILCHKWHFNPETLLNTMRAAGLHIKKMGNGGNPNRRDTDNPDFGWPCKGLCVYSRKIFIAEAENALVVFLVSV